MECESYDIITTEDPGRTVIKTGVVNCSVPTTDSGRALCFSSWLNNSEIGFQIVKKGCWYNHEECYDRSLCEQLTEPVRDVAFCCCEGSLCNRVIDFWEHGAVVVVDGFTTVSLFVQEADRPRLQDVVMLGVLPILVTAVLFAAIFIFRSVCFRPKPVVPVCVFLCLLVCYCCRLTGSYWLQNVAPLYCCWLTGSYWLLNVAPLYNVTGNAGVETAAIFSMIFLFFSRDARVATATNIICCQQQIQAMC